MQAPQHGIRDLFLALLLVAIHGPSLTTTVVVLGVTTWMPAARLVRGEILSVLSKYELAAWIGRLGPDFAKDLRTTLAARYSLDRPQIVSEQVSIARTACGPYSR